MKETENKPLINININKSSALIGGYFINNNKGILI